ncbi:hypothetical protein K443DRAFT_662488 [Laccaria amethystina LaAM-08-1]|uniref:Uncharacterized protein n=1 Tax=Laccaria amethystina LaAM-08-1 TaxID=1095629 RepID=A0A0C9WRK1_9AGAR|nr:hypothetical protein K443DRAFT_662488 [Laccaria amethystina LaAM-08-1]
MFRGDGSSTPLTVTYILIQDGSLSISTPSPSSSSSSSPLSNSIASSSSLSTKIISSLLSSVSSFPSSPLPFFSFSFHIPLGAVIGGLVLIFILGFAICFCKRRHSPSYKKAEVQPFYVPGP